MLFSGENIRFGVHTLDSGLFYRIFIGNSLIIIIQNYFRTIKRYCIATSTESLGLKRSMFLPEIALKIDLTPVCAPIRRIVFDRDNDERESDVSTPVVSVIG